MSKAILVIDMPEKCYECPLMNKDMYCKGFKPYYAKDGTHITRMCVEDYVMRGTKHSSCPLKPLPPYLEITKDMEEWKQHYRQGINDTISKIEGTFMQNI